MLESVIQDLTRCASCEHSTVGPIHEDCQLMMRNALALLKDYKTCVNELCLECGNYKHEHEGACADCRWLKVRRGW